MNIVATEKEFFEKYDSEINYPNAPFPDGLTAKCWSPTPYVCIAWNYAFISMILLVKVIELRCKINRHKILC